MNRFFALLLILGLLPSAAISSGLESRIQAERAKAQQIHERLDQKRGELHAAKVRVGNLKVQLAQTNSAIIDVNTTIGSLQLQENSTQRRLAWNNIQLAAAKKTLALHDSLLKKRLVSIYERGDFSYLNVLLAASSFSDFVERWDDLRLLIAANQRAVRERRRSEQRVSKVQAALQSAQIALAQQQEAQRRARNQLATLADERAQLVSVADAQRSHIAGQVAEMEDLSSTEEASLEALIVERQREIAAQQAAARRAAGIVGVVPQGPAGALAWPVTGTITSPFGMRRSPFGSGLEFHQGLDIAAPTGTTVTAAAAGTIISAGWYGGYGNYILIDHGGGLSTGYGHLSQIFVAAGQSVQRGQAIGAVGSTGASTGPHLHFEVRVNGKPVDPAARLH
ncbi:MAG: peptidoglycan DD-metalloendopeptidase family protein [Candidatus Eremiobacteraeota bacterium]|nr:peptidoglycan DD-metalloendopeptidase family protein [Candidatus Eremiobacteraeota bacterium]